MEEKPIPVWQRITGAVALTVTVAVIAVWHSRLPADLWPPDASRVAPNLLASVIQWAIILTVAALLWPPTRRRIHRFADRKIGPIHDHLTAIRAHHLAHHDSLEEIHRTLAHIIRHSPEIPDLPDRPTERP